MDQQTKIAATNPEILACHLDLVLSINEKMNLTRITSKESAKILHIEDSLLGLPYLNNAPEGRYGDMGSGAGYPGIVLAIESRRDTVLIDSVKKKAAALREMVSTLGLEDKISVFDGRIEELAKSQPRSFAVLTARALSSLDSLLELASPLLQNHGQLICYKAKLSKEEEEAAAAISHETAMYLIKRDEYLLSDQETTRTILVYEKRGNPSIKLPRNIGAAQKHPLKPRSK